MYSLIYPSIKMFKFQKKDNAFWVFTYKVLNLFLIYLITCLDQLSSKVSKTKF